MFGFVDNNITSDVLAVTSAASVTIDSSVAQIHKWVMDQNTTITITGTGAFVYLVVTDDTNARTITWSGIHAPAGTYVLTAGKKHTFHFIWDGAEFSLVSVNALS